MKQYKTLEKLLKIIAEEKEKSKAMLLQIEELQAELRQSKLKNRI